ncbi:MAG: D-aminoacylase [Armatimonadetes bacterium]|nr:D-aminoacylase [Armatimonadota bacterium]MDE2207079.1 D-aminoacylase [Armatimonadota bacterium]
MTSSGTVIRNATIVDGSGAPGCIADLHFVDGLIVATGRLPATMDGVESIDATGLTVAPGFIDIHTHADLALLAHPQHLPKVMQGVTTEVFTNCGLGFAPVTGEALAVQRRYLGGLFGDASDGSVDCSWESVGDLLSQYQRTGIGCNVVYLAPHGAVRVSVMGMQNRPATDGELNAMAALLEEAIADGAWGMSTGLWYAPMRSASRDELVRLCRTAGFFATHQRDYGERLFEATRESCDIAREAGVPVQISHLQLNGPANAGRAGELIEILERERASGVDVTSDIYPYTAGSSLLQALLPEWCTEGGPVRLEERLNDAQQRSAIERDLAATGFNWEQYRLSGAQSADGARHEGWRFTDAAEARGMSVPAWLCRVIAQERFAACYINHSAHEGNVREMLQWRHQMIGSDGLHLRGTCHPRLYGCFPRVLGRYVREERILTLEDAIYKMTGSPAARLGLDRRGLVRPGYAADIAVFDAARIADTATFEAPRSTPIGIEWVFVNGVAAVRHGKPTNNLAGAVLRRRHSL